MFSKLTVTEPRESGDLVTLEEVKAELQITGTETDDYLALLITRMSTIIESFCRRIFAVEGLEETFRLRGQASESLVLDRDPVTAVTSVAADGIALDGDEYEYDAEAGLLYRLVGDDQVLWTGSSIVVAYSAGYAITPGPVQKAMFDMIKLGQASRTRDPSLRSENILEGLYSYTLFVPTDMVGGLPPDVAANLAPFVKIVVG